MERKGTITFIESVLKDYLFNTHNAVNHDGCEPDEALDFIKNQYTGLLLCIKRYIGECVVDKIWLNIALRDFARLLVEPILLHFNDLE